MQMLRNGGFARMWDWGFLRSCFDRGIVPSDVDGIVERNRQFLVLETKHPNEREMSTGQRLLLEAFAAKDFHVVVITGYQSHAKTDIEAWEAWLPQHTGDGRYCGCSKVYGTELVQLMTGLRQWYDWADGRLDRRWVFRMEDSHARA